MSVSHPNGRDLGRDEPGRRRRRGCGPVALVVAIVLLLGVVAVLDEVARRVAEHRAETTLQQRLGTSQAVDVHFGGWPFSVALLTGRVSSMHLSAPDLTVRSTASQATIRQVDVHANGVHDVRHPGTARADHLTIAGTVSWAELSQHAGATLAFAGDGRASFTRTIDVFGTQQKVDVTARPGIDSTTHKVVLTDVQGTVGGVALPSSLLTSLASSMADRIDLPTKQGLVYTGATATADGVRATMQGSDVALDSLR